MRNRRGVLLAIAVAIAGAAFWVALRGTGDGIAPRAPMNQASDQFGAVDTAGEQPRLEGIHRRHSDAAPLPPSSASTTEPGTIRGRVVDDQGDVVPELTVQLSTDRRYADCDAKGRFEFRQVPPGRHRIEAFEAVGTPVGDGVELMLAVGQILDGLEIVVPRPLPLGGTVVNGAGHPVSDLPLQFSVRAAHGIQGWMLRTPVRTDDHGRFLTRVWRKGVYRARGPKTLLLGTAEAGREDASLVYREGGASTLTVRVLDPTGAPVPHATLMVHTGSSPGAFVGIEQQVVDGLARVTREPFQRYVKLKVSKPLDGEGRPLPLAAQATGLLNPDEAEVVVVLEIAQRIAGRVVDEEGGAVEGVGVFAWQYTASGAETHVRGASGPTGAFALEGCPPGAMRVQAGVDSAREWLPGPPVDAQAGEEDLVLTVRRSATLHIIVVGPDGAPVEGATVSAVHDAGYLPQSSRVKTGSDGRASLLGLPPNSPLEVQVTTEGSSAVLPFALLSGLSAPGERVVRLEAPMAIRGRVIDASGRPRGGMSVVGQSQDPAGSVENVKSEPVTGAFMLQRLRRGTARVWLGWGPDNRPPTRFVEVDAPAEGIDLVIPASIPVEGRLLVENPLEWSIAWALPYGSAMGTIEEDGRFRIEHARGPVGAILARPLGVPVPGVTTPQIDSLIALLAGVRPEDGPFILVPEIGAVIAGTIRDCPPADSRPLNLRVWAKRGDVTLMGTLDDVGGFEIHGVPRGEWDIELWNKDVLDNAPNVRAGTRGVTLEYR